MKRPYRRKYTDQALIEAIKTSVSWRQVLTKIGLKEAGGNYESVKDVARELNLDCAHFLGQSYRKGSTVPVVKAEKLSKVLVNGRKCGSHHLKNRLLKAGLKQHKCENCNGIEWCGNKIPLELDHVNGIRSDNRIENLKLLCPNCHALTPTYRGKNIGRLTQLEEVSHLKREC